MTTAIARQRRTKIICTLGPATSEPDVIRSLVQRGMNVARINMSHGSHESHRVAVERVREAAERQGVTVAVMGDLQGPRIRTGLLQNGPVQLREGEEFILYTAPRAGTTAGVSLDYRELSNDVGPGDRIVLSDGLIELKVEEARPDEVKTRVVHGGRLAEHQGVNLPGGAASLPSLTAKDIEDLAFLLDLGVDYIAQSFVRTADDIRETKGRIAAAGASTPVIAKIEKRQAVEHLDEILDAADGAMVARGDLGVELPLEEVPLCQKTIIKAAEHYLVPVITATQMLESMVHNFRPTRAEASDVANAIWDGTDAVMLSAETAIGEYPVEALTTMDRIARAAESMPVRHDVAYSHHGHDEFSYDIARAARQIAETRDDVRVIAAFTKSGYTARLISKERPAVPVLAFAPDAKVMRRAALYWGVMPRECRMLRNVDEMVAEVDRSVQAQYAVRAGETAIILASLPVELSGTTNFLKLHTIGEV